MGMGLAGAAIATVIAQAVVAAFNLSYLFRNNRNIFSLDSLKLSCQRLKTIIRIGVSPFGQTLIPSVIIIFTNWQCIRYGGDDALSVFSLLSYVLASVQLLLQGVGDGVQPLLSFYYGAGQTQHIRFLFKKGHQRLDHYFALDRCGRLAAARADHNPVRPDRQSGTAGAARTDHHRLLLPDGRYHPLYQRLFLRGRKTNVSTLLVYIEPCLFFPIALWTLPLFWGLNGVWAAYPAAQLALAVLCVALYIRVEHRSHAAQLKTC